MQEVAPAWLSGVGAATAQPRLHARVFTLRLRRRPAGTWFVQQGKRGLIMWRPSAVAHSGHLAKPGADQTQNKSTLSECCPVPAI